jgi:hypothetical protein
MHRAVSVLLMLTYVAIHATSYSHAHRSDHSAGDDHHDSGHRHAGHRHSGQRHFHFHFHGWHSHSADATKQKEDRHQDVMPTVDVPFDDLHDLAAFSLPDSIAVTSSPSSPIVTRCFLQADGLLHSVHLDSSVPGQQSPPITVPQGSIARTPLYLRSRVILC